MKYDEPEMTVLQACTNKVKATTIEEEEYWHNKAREIYRANIKKEV